MPRWIRRTARIAAAVAVAVAVAVVLIAFLTDAHVTYSAEQEPVQQLADDPSVDVQWSYGDVVMTPSDPAQAGGIGLVFLAGAKVDPLAYAPKLSGIVATGVTVVIVRPVANYAILEFRPFSDFTARAPGVQEWFVGGHSLGGVKACQYAADAGNDVAGLVLFASYCAGDEADLGVPVLSVSGSNDGLSTPAKIEASVSQLPAGTEFVQIEGANHAQFGDYGIQPGDGESTIDDTAMHQQLTDALTAFLEGVTAA